jgi:hypothetical protein
MQSVDLDGLKALDRDLKEILDDRPNLRREMFARIGEAVLDEVRTRIDVSIDDSEGHVQSWQESHVGSGGGYAAVRAESGIDEETAGEWAGQNSSMGAITNYLENGHKVRPPSGYAKRRRKGRAKKAYVEGHHFYLGARLMAESIAIREAEDYVEEIAKKLEG